MLETPNSSTLKLFRDELIELAELVSQSVVTVRATDTTLNSGSGSGWFHRPNVIVTNNHVVESKSEKKASSLKIRLKGGRVVPGKLIGTDPMCDLAVIECDVSDIKPLPLNTDPLRLGELCFAFGSPLGEYTESVTLGIVSGLNRRMPLENGRSIEGLIQTDAEINPGNSGGPLVDLDGELLGVNVMIRRDGRGMGFAIPSETVGSVVPELIEHGNVLRPKLGVALEVIEHDRDGIEGEALRVSNAPAGHLLQRGDVLLSIASRPINSRRDLFDVMRRQLLDTETVIEVVREGSTQRLVMVLSKPLD
jgi:S1-C subfamily serine protease